MIFLNEVSKDLKTLRPKRTFQYRETKAQRGELSCQTMLVASLGEAACSVGHH